MRCRIGIPLILVCLAILTPFAEAAPQTQLGVTSQQAQNAPSAPLPPGLSDDDIVTVMVQVAEPIGVRSAHNRRVQIKTAQDQLISSLEQAGAVVLFQTQVAYNGIAVSVPVERIEALRTIAGVAGVHVITPKAQVALDEGEISAISLTQATPSGLSGQGVSIAVIDSGIDYTHADFGGAGTPEAYASNDRAIIEPESFPTNRVVGGFDFAGDAYDASGASGSAIPTADADPIDCNGRGTHIAGVAAGSGVTSDGKTYLGPYQASSKYHNLRIAPGVAPQANLYALKVFGCSEHATTTLTVQAIEWALDPNRDGDTSDHLDVAIIAMGTPFGGNDDPDAIAVNNAVQAGMVVVVAGGQNNNTFYAVNSPASAQQAIAVGASIGSPNPIVLPKVSYAEPDCYKQGDLAAAFVADGQGTITNSSPDCTYQVGIASYKKFDGIIDHQQIFDWVSTVVEPGQTVYLGVRLPPCATQIDIFHGPVLLSLNQQRYGPRLLAARHAGGTNYCPADNAPVYGLVTSTPRGIQRGNEALKPDLVAPSIAIQSAAMGSGNDSAVRSEVWAGVAQVAGAAALVRQLHPDWHPTQVKAALMNTASPVLMDTGAPYPVSLTGAGQLNLTPLAAVDILAYSSAENSDVSLVFGAPWVSKLWTATKTLHLENKGATAQQVSLSETVSASEPGVTVELPSTPIEIPAGSVVDVPINLTIDPTKLDFSPDVSTSLLQDDAERYYIAEHSGYVQVRSNTRVVQVPLVVMPKSASDAKAASPLLMLPSDASTFSLSLHNTGARNANLIDVQPNTQLALVSAFELGASSAEESTLSGNLGAADIQYIGITSDLARSRDIANSVIFFGISTYKPWSTPNEVQFWVYIDSNSDGVDDFVVVNTSWRHQATDLPNDAFYLQLYKIRSDGSLESTYGFSAWNDLRPFSLPPYIDAAPFNSSVMFAGIGVRFLELPVGQTRIRYHVETRARDANYFNQIIDRVPAIGSLEYDIARPVIAPLNTRGALSRRPLFLDTEGGVVTGVVNPSLLAQRSGQRMLLLHHHNAPSAQAELVEVRNTLPHLASATRGSQVFFIPMVSDAP